MDDYLSKPLRMQQLAPMLQKWLPMVELDDQSTPAIEGQTSQPLALELPIWSPATLRELVGENPAMHRRLMDKFLRSASEQVPAIGVAMAAGKLKEVAGLAHALKSAARSVGALALGELCQKMETTGNAEEAPACAALAQGLAAAFTTAQGAILEHLAHKQ
jgi:HPt (histidine-containing phosphotransfer) domain-containing protein